MLMKQFTYMVFRYYALQATYTHRRARELDDSA